MAGSSGMAWVRATHEAGLIPRGQMVRWAADGLRFRLRGSTDATTRRVMTEIKLMMAGTPAVRMTRLAPQVMAGVLPRIYPQMLAEVHAHQDAGRPAFIVSAAGNDLVELVAHVLGMEGGIGTRYELDADGLLTGELEGPFMYGEGKLEGMRGFAESHDLELSASWAYSDSISDLPMLRAVGHPVAVNPDRELALTARQEGWRVMRFERLGRQIMIAATAITAAAIGGGSALAARRSGRRRTG